METLGLDVSEHGMWGYPEFYIPVPGGYGTEHHAHRRVTTPKKLHRRHRPRSRLRRPASLDPRLSADNACVLQHKRCLPRRAHLSS